SAAFIADPVTIIASSAALRPGASDASSARARPGMEAIAQLPVSRIDRKRTVDADKEAPWKRFFASDFQERLYCDRFAAARENAPLRRCFWVASAQRAHIEVRR